MQILTVQTNKELGVSSMKKLFTSLIALVILVVSQPVFAATAVTVPIAVTLPQILKLDVVVKQVTNGQDPSAGATVFDTTQGISTGMNFGTLALNSYGVWAPAIPCYFTAFLYPATSGRPYKITQTCAGIVSGTSNLNQSLTMTPDFKTQDSFTPPYTTPQPPMSTNSGSTLGSAGLAVGANLKVYDSGSGGGGCIVRCYYGLATGNTDPANGTVDPPGAVPLTSSAPTGSYAGSVTFTIVLK